MTPPRNTPQLLVALAAVLAASPLAEAQVKPRFVVVVDTSGSMMRTAQLADLRFERSCVANSDCTALGLAACTAVPGGGGAKICTCANDGQCANVANLGVTSSCVARGDGLSVCQQTDGLQTHGDGSAEQPGCDQDGNGLFDDSRIFQAKSALFNVVSAFGEIDFALARYAQINGGQACTSDAQCAAVGAGLMCASDGFCRNCRTPSQRFCTANGDCTPFGGGLSCIRVTGSAACSLAASNCVCLDSSLNASGVRWTADEARDGGSCQLDSYDECASGAYSCAASGGSAACAALGDRAVCDANKTDLTCQGATNPLGHVVTCGDTSANLLQSTVSATNDPQCINYAGTCGGADVLEPFPATGADNANEILAWLDGQETDFGGGAGADPELRATGDTPLSASLDDVRAFLTNNADGVLLDDLSTPCRKYRVILLTDGQETCGGDPVTSASDLRNLSITRTDGQTVSVDVQTFVVGFSICPDPVAGCAESAELDAIAAAGGTDTAILVNDQDALQQALFDIVSGSILVERCNGLDDDCDGDRDEDFRPPLGDGCAVGVGACRATGGFVCAGDGRGVVCDAVAGTPGTESCNGLDDDCDGQIDEAPLRCGVPDGCDGVDNDTDGQTDEDFVPATCGATDEGECSLGQTVCTAGVLSCTAVGPRAEECDGADNDCDGQIDGFTDPCYDPADAGCSLVTGACVGECRLGTQTCVAGDPGACTDDVHPVAELCDELDNDCDGASDEDFTDKGGACSAGVGSCRRDGVFVCDAADRTRTRCDAVAGAAGAEVCDCRDNDCDGTADDGLTCRCGSDVGECSRGDLVCNGDGSIGCSDVKPVAEACDGLDNDCDGAADEDFPGLGSGCDVGALGCRGVVVCAAGGGGTACEPRPAAEVCDGRDNDCDGVADEAGDLAAPFGQPCGAGECVGTLVCQGGGAVCDGPAPGTEVCDTGLRDEDCDGQVNESDPQLGGACGSGPTVGICRHGELACDAGGQLVCDGEVLPAPAELCNALDDDCDGETDEGFGVGDACENGDLGICVRGGVVVCTADATGSFCDAPAGVPEVEVCNGLDDDCDGAIDESDPQAGLPCGSPVGECTQGTFECNSLATPPRLECAGGSTGIAESCNGLDDDCDGAFDEPDPLTAFPEEGQPCLPDALLPFCDAGTQTCAGTCAPGATRCVAGGLGCEGAVLPSPELCDTLDNDCDGEVDEDSCEVGFACVNGACLEDCSNDEFACDPGFLCTTIGDGRFCVRGPCAGVRCAAGEFCDSDTGACRELCEIATCNATQECAAGQCFNCFDAGHPCAVGQLCQSNGPAEPPACVADPCAGVTCRANEACAGGACVPACGGVVCPEGKRCEAGACIEDACSGVDCPLGQVCSVASGECVQGCQGIFCPQGEVCVEGQCIDDPCRAIDCPEGTICDPATRQCLDDPNRIEVVATGAGGTACATAGGGGGQGASLALALLAALLGGGRPRRRRPTRGAPRASGTPGTPGTEVRS